LTPGIGFSSHRPSNGALDRHAFRP
jgi:hypothetical protein